MPINHWDEHRAYHLIARAGITGGRFQGPAFELGASFLRHTVGAVNHWNKLERPAVYMEQGRVKTLTLSVINTPKHT